MNRYCAAVLCSVLCALCSPLHAQGKRPLKIDDYFALKRLSDPRVSPDGKWVAYTISASDLKTDKSESRIWMSPVAGGDMVAHPVPVGALVLDELVPGIGSRLRFHQPVGHDASPYGSTFFHGFTDTRSNSPALA